MSAPVFFRLTERLAERPSADVRSRPFFRFFELFGDDEYAALLDSASTDERLGRFSFIGARPLAVLRARRIVGAPPGANASLELVEFFTNDGRSDSTANRRELVGDPFSFLRETQKRIRPVNHIDDGRNEVPFLGGAMGYFGYEAGQFIETLSDHAEDDLHLPDLYLFWPTIVLSHCHATGATFLSTIGVGGDLAAARGDAERLQSETIQKQEAFRANCLCSTREPCPPRNATEGVPYNEDAVKPRVTVSSYFTPETYASAVDEIKARIAEGDVYQACMTQRMQTPLPAEATPWSLYRTLREINPAPFAAYLKLPEVAVVCSSPERFLKLDENGVAESRPIKGTRPRGVSPEEDERLERELGESEKDRAENVMIVDLVRNDFGRVCRFGTVTTPDVLKIERYSTVFQLVSTVRGELREDCDAVDLIRACFPGGSMTGAPKIAAMELLDRLEPVQRGIYSGAIGYLDFDGPTDLNIVIRTIVVKDGACYFHVGGGVVSDSDPAQEYQESLDKAKALIAAIENERR